MRHEISVSFDHYLTRPTLPAYPPVDKGVREYFDKPDKKSDQHLQVEYTIFMTELFKYTSETIKCERFKDSANLASDWADYLLDGQNSLGVGKNREEFYNTIVTNAKAVSRRGDRIGFC